jgi:hypothetical protein
MHGPTRGELHSPGTGQLECSGAGRCENPIRVASADVCFGTSSGEAKRRPIDTLSRRRVRRVIARTREAGERRLGEIQAKVVAAHPRGAKPMGGAGSRRLKNPHDCKALPEGANPETDVR